MIAKTARPPRDRHRRVAACLLAAALVALGSPGAGQQRATPETGAPRQGWPQRPGAFRPLEITTPPADAVPQAVAAAPAEPEFVPNDVLVQFEADATEATRAAARAAANAQLASALGPDARLERLTTSLPVADAIAILESLPQVEFAEPNWIVRHTAVADESYYKGGWMWGLYGEATTPVNVYGSRAAELWDAGFTGSDTVYVAVIDEGIDFEHPELAENIWTNPFDPADGIDNDGNGKVDDVHGWDFFENDNSIYDGDPFHMDLDSHGTHVAGTIGARGGNGAGVAGMNWNVTIISGKFLGPNGGTTENAVRAIDYITDLKKLHGLNIVATNNSWSGGAYSTALHQAIVRAAKQGILFFAAAGNYSSDNDRYAIYPANYSTLVSVGSESSAGYEAVTAVAAMTSTGARAYFSNYGATTVDIAAPGSDILSTWPQGGYNTISGTSMATPHVTGAAALYKSIHPAASANEIRSAILAYGVATPTFNGTTVTGRRLNVSQFHAPRRLSISDAGRTEGNAGTSNATFTVSLSEPSSVTVTARYSTSDITAASRIGGANPSSIVIPSSGSALPYPSAITIPPGFAAITNVRVTLNGFSHPYPGDVDILLVGPRGQTCVLMSDVTPYDATNLTLTFDDAGIPMPTSGYLTSTTYRPTNSGGTTDPFPSPAPAAPHGSALSVFNGTAPTGEWRLFIVDDLGGISGTVSGGWSLTFSPGVGTDYVARSGMVTFAPGSTSQTIDVPVVGDVAIEQPETFRMTLFDPSNASILDDEGIGTIEDDDFIGPVGAGQLIMASHIVQLRAAINQARAARGISAFPFADPDLAAQRTIRTVHILHLREALEAVYAAAQRPLPSYTDTVIIPGVTVVKRAHINEIALALAMLP